MTDDLHGYGPYAGVDAQRVIVCSVGHGWQKWF